MSLTLALRCRFPAEDMNVRFEREALDEIVATSEGYPYFLQEWGYHVWNVAGSSPITAEDVLQTSSIVSS